MVAAPCDPARYAARRSRIQAHSRTSETLVDDATGEPAATRTNFGASRWITTSPSSIEKFSSDSEPSSLRTKIAGSSAPVCERDPRVYAIIRGCGGPQRPVAAIPVVGVLRRRQLSLAPAPVRAPHSTLSPDYSSRGGY